MMHKQILAMLLPALFMLGLPTVFAQGITVSGATTANTTESKSYTANVGTHSSTASASYWSATGGTASAQALYSATITWNTALPANRVDYVLEDIFSDFYTGSLNVTVAVPLPTGTFTITNNCNSTNVLRNSSPSADYDWYWQTSSTGTSTALGSSSSVNITSAGTLYLRARTKTAAYRWSTAQTVGSITISTQPSVPSTAHHGYVISGTSVPVALSVSSSGASAYRWYKVTVTGDSLITGPTGISYTPSVSATTDYKVEAMNGNCPAASRKQVTANVYPEPVVSKSHNGKITMGQPVTLSVGNFSYDSYQWKRNGTNIPGATASSHTTRLAGNYTVSVTESSAPAHTSAEPSNVTVGPSGQDINYMVANTVLVKNITQRDSVDLLPAEKNSQVVQYVDGLGRVMQTVSTQGSPLKKDIIQPVVYDGFGRVHRSYLPVVTGSNTGWYNPNLIATNGRYQNTAANFYSNNPAGAIAQDTIPYSETLFEPSPLNRPLKQYGPGQEWKGNDKFVEMKYQLNEHGAGSSGTAEKVIAWKVSSGLPVRAGVRSGYVVTGGYYTTGQLNIRSTKDEQGNEVREYTNKNRQVVLKKVQAESGVSSNLNSATGWALTYYVYDDLGNLRFVFPPEMSKVLHGSDTAAANTIRRTNWAFQYTYDSRKRMITKQVPGAGPVYMVYDKRDRLVLTQDANQRSGSNKYWTFTKYDALNRPVLTGIKDTSVLLTQAQMQSAVDVHYAKAWASLYETFIGTATNNMHGYSNKSYPVLTGPETTNESKRYLSVTYYDTYDFKSLWTGSYNYMDENLSQTANGVTYNQPDAEFTSVKGQITGTKIKVLDGGVAGGYTWLKSITYYDDRYRPVQVIADNYKGGTDRITNVYDFVGKVLKTKSVHEEADITWKEVVGATVTGNILQRNVSPNSWNTSGAVSVEQLGASQDGWFEVVVSEITSHNRMIGFADSNPDLDYTSIDYAFYLSATTLRIFENGVSKLNPTRTIASGDVLRISRKGGTVRYYLNGTLIYTSLTSSTAALMIDAALSTNGSTLTGVRSSFDSTTHTTTRSFNYDHAGRLLNTWHQLGNGPEILLVKNEYNELGQLIDKKLHSTDGERFKQSVDHAYNIRGWLTKINESDLSAADEDASRDLFGMQLGYNDDLGISSTALYNGNISGIKWSNNQALGDIRQNAYTYTYDELNRIKTSVYKEKESSWTTASNYGNQETGFTYDLNGNIKTLQRNDRRASGWMDNLTYDYGSTQSNRLLKVTDSGDKTKGFIDVESSGDDYAYDPNGNLIWDGNKGGTETLANGSFDSGNASWTITNTARLTFTGGEVRVVTGGAVATLKQAGIAAGKPYVVVIDMERTGGTLSAIVGGTTTDLTTTGVHTLSVTAGTANTDFMISLGTTFVGKIKSISVKGATVIGYNYLNLPELVTRPGDRSLRYIYDAAGRKLRQEVSMNNAPEKSTDYAGEYIYENDTLQLINHEEGRIIPGPSPEYQYHLKDHLGNVRMTFTSKQQVDTYTATLETASEETESAAFSPSYENATIINSNLYNKTTSGSKSQRLSAANADEIVGLAKSLSVMPGDTVHIRVYGKYYTPTNTNSNAATAMLASMAQAFGVSGASTGEALKVYNRLDEMFGSGFLLTSENWEDEEAPKAFLNYILFDEDFVPYDMGWDQIDAGALETGMNVTHDELVLLAPVTKPGYIYIYLSNENDKLVDVYFDDLTIEHKLSPVLQQDDYYAFGLNFNSYQRENSTKNKFKFQGQEHIEDLDLGWDSFKWRNHQPEIGRFFNIDPLASDYMYNSPYAFCENQVTTFFELEGLEKGGRASANTIRPRTGGNPVTISQAARSAANIANRPPGFASTTPRQGAMFTTSTRYTFDRGTGNGANASNNYGRTSNGGDERDFDNTHNQGNKAGGSLKVAMDIADNAKKIIDGVSEITVNESFTQHEGATFSLGKDIVVGDMLTNSKLAGLENDYQQAVRQDARGNMSEEEWNNLPEGAQILLIGFSQNKAGPSPLQQALAKVQEGTEKDKKKREHATISQGPD